MLDLAITGFTLALLVAGMRRPFVWVLAYLYIDILLPQKISYLLLAALPISLIAFVLAFLGWALLDNKADSRFTLRQALILILLGWCGLTTMFADFPVEAADKWSWVWKSLIFALVFPLTLRTRLRLEAATLVMVLTAGAIIITGGIKTLAGGGGYGTLRLFVADNAGLYEGSTLSMVAVAMIPLIWWLARHGTIYPKGRMVTLFAVALTFAALMIPIGTATRTGLLCIALLGVLALRSVKRRFLFVTLAVAGALVSIPFLPDTYTRRMDTIGNHQSDESASTRVAVWMWTLDYVSEHPLGGGFDSFRGNKIRVETRKVSGDGNNQTITINEGYDQSRAFHSAYFEVLGEQGYPGLLLWLWLQVLGLWQMERIRQRWKNKTGPNDSWKAPLANALQQAQLVYLVGALFVGIAYQPFIFMLIGLQCGLWSYLKRTDTPIGAPIRRQAALAQGQAT